MKFDKRFRYGTFSTVMLLLAAVLFVLVNLLAGEFDRTHDLTTEQIFSLTPQSREFLAELEQDVTITLVARTGHEYPAAPIISRITNQLLDEYAAFPQITVETRDPLINPAVIHRFAADAGFEGGIPDHSLVVESGGQIRVIPPDDMYTAERNPFTGAIFRMVSYDVEREITRAVQHVTQGAEAIVYFVTGSGETPLSPSLVTFLEDENFIFREINLVTSEVPADADILFISMPARDWPQHKAARVQNFLEAEGSAFFALNFILESTPNLANVLDAYGLALTDRLILESDEQHILDLTQLVGRRYMAPQFLPHEITDNLLALDFANILPMYTVELQEQAVRRQTLTIEPLWITSAGAFSRSFETEADTLARIPGDLSGPFPLAFAVTDRIFQDGAAYYTRIVATNNNRFFDIRFHGDGNLHFVLNSLRFMSDQPPGVFVPTRMLPGHSPFVISGGTANILSIISMGGIPLIFLIAGGVVWFRRRHS